MVTNWVVSDPEMYSCAVKSLEVHSQGVGRLAIGGSDEEPFLLPPSFRGLTILGISGPAGSCITLICPSAFMRRSLLSVSVFKLPPYYKDASH